jgi:GNAT superfamily N-acetyltransferase
MTNYRQAFTDDLTELNKLNPVGEINWKSEFWDSRMPDGIVCVYDYGGELVGVEGYMGGYPLFKNGNIFLSHKSERTLVLPSMRGKGVFVKLVQECHQRALDLDSAFSWGATSAIKPFEKAGFQGFQKWRKYYFVGFKPWYQSIGIFKLLDFIKNVYQFSIKRDLNNMMLLGTTVSDFIPRPWLRRGDFIGEQVDFKSLTDIARQISENAGTQYDDFVLHLSEDFLAWLASRDITIKCVAIRGSNNQNAGYVCYKQTKDLILIEDFGFASGMNFAEILDAFKFYLRENCQASSAGSFVLPLNIRNKFHQQVKKAISRFVVSSPPLGSFVIKPGKQKPDIGQLRLTPIWLEL